MVPAAGSGERLGAGLPKALVEVAGVAMVARAVDGLLASGIVDDVIVVAPAEHLEAMAAVVPTTARVVPGGHDRVASVSLGLQAVDEPGEARARQQHPVGQLGHPQAALRRLDQLQQHVVPTQRHPGLVGQLPLQLAHHVGVAAQERPPHLDLPVRRA